MKRPHLGDRRRCNAFLERREEWDKDVNATMKYWLRVPKDIEGIYTGWRMASEGHEEWDEYHNRNYTPGRWFEVWHVVPNERQNKVLVLPDDVVWPGAPTQAELEGKLCGTCSKTTCNLRNPSARWKSGVCPYWTPCRDKENE